jgi:HAMP domain-containing protein
MKWYKSMVSKIQLQDMVRAYITSKNIDSLQAVEKDYARTVKIITSLLKRMQRRVATEESQRLSNIADSFAALQAKDEIGQLENALQTMVTGLKAQVHVAEQIAAGDLTVEVHARSQADALAVSMHQVLTTLRGLEEEIQGLVRSAQAGHLHTRGEVAKFRGAFATLVHGIKGFAVVAEEVRNLAMRSAEAARNTATIINDAVQRAEGGVVLEAAGTAEELAHQATEMHHLVGTFQLQMEHEPASFPQAYASAVS